MRDQGGPAPVNGAFDAVCALCPVTGRNSIALLDFHGRASHELQHGNCETLFGEALFEVLRFNACKLGL